MPKKRKKTHRASGSPPLTRGTYDIHWLAEDHTKPSYNRLKHHPLKEKEGSRDRIRDFLSQAIFDHHFHRQRVADRLEALGHEEAARFFASELPRDNKTRKGNFGEVVASENLIQRQGYLMPVFKIRFRDSHDLPMRGEDIVAFEIDAENRIKRIIIGEAKATLKYSKSTVTKALERLNKAYHPRPMTLSMLAEILYETGNEILGRDVDRVSYELMSRNFPRDNWIFLINQKQPYDVFGCIEDNEDVIPNLHCASLKLKDMTEFVNDLFDNTSLSR